VSSDCTQGQQRTGHLHKVSAVPLNVVTGPNTFRGKSHCLHAVYVIGCWKNLKKSGLIVPKDNNEQVTDIRSALSL
jgi:hypothetical protein